MPVLLEHALPRLGRAYPLASGRHRLANSRTFRRMLASFPREMTVRTPGGLLQVQSDDYTGRAVMLFGDMDRKISWVLDRVLRPGDSMLDVGANCGLFSMRAGRRVGDSGHVHGVEPQSGLAEACRASAALNRYRHVTFHQVALSEHPGTMDLHAPIGNTGAASLTRRFDVDETVERVQVANTSDFLEALGIERWRLWKLDVEGHEAALLRGATRYLCGPGRPDVIVFEEQTLPAQAESIPLLEELGYDVFGLPRAILRPRLEPVATTPRAFDYVAVERNARPQIDSQLRIE